MSDLIYREEALDSICDTVCDSGSECMDCPFKSVIGVLLRVPSVERRGRWEEVNQIIDQSEYELLDGIGMPYHARTFSAEEYDTIKGVVEYIRKAIESEE